MKITLKIISIAIAFALLITSITWFIDINNLVKIIDRPNLTMTWFLAHPLAFPEVQKIAVFSVLKGFAPVVILLMMISQLNNSNARVIRGAVIVKGKELAAKTREKKYTQIQVAGVPIPVNCETSHLLMSGSTGSGKTTATDEILDGALSRGDRVIVVDPNGHALSKFGKPGDSVLNPFDNRTKNWSIFNELRNQYDFERITKSVIPDSADEGAQQWHRYAQQLFAETLRALTTNGETTTERLIWWLTQSSTAELKSLLVGTAANGLFEPNAEKALASTRFIIAAHMGAFQYLREGKFSLIDWLKSGNGNLYITWREDMITTLRPLVSSWVDILIASILTLPESPKRPLWLFLDELASLQRLSSLEAALTKGRKHGLRVVAGLQSVSQLVSIYGQHNATSILSCFRNLLALGCSNADPVTAETISKSLGQAEVERASKTYSKNSNGHSTSTSYHRTLEYVVLPSELMKLKPLSGYLKFAGDYPIGQIKLIPNENPQTVQPFVER